MVSLCWTWVYWYFLILCAGRAMTYARQFLLSTAAGRRSGVPGVVVIIADEKSADDLSKPAATVRADGKPYKIRPNILNLHTHTANHPGCSVPCSYEWVSAVITLSLRCDSVGGRNWTGRPYRAPFGSDWWQHSESDLCSRHKSALWSPPRPGRPPLWPCTGDRCHGQIRSIRLSCH